MVWAITHAPALQDLLDNTVKGMSTNACLGPVMLQAASTVCRWSTIISAAVALVTQVHSF